MQHFDRVMLNHAQIGQFQRRNLFEQTAYPGRVHFDAEVVVLRMGRRDCGGGFAHAETDFQDFRRAAAECLVEIDDMRRERNAVARQQRVVGALLRVRHAPLAQNETADRAVDGGHGR